MISPEYLTPKQRRRLEKGQDINPPFVMFGPQVNDQFTEQMALASVRFDYPGVHWALDRGPDEYGYITLRSYPCPNTHGHALPGCYGCCDCRDMG